MAIEFYCSNCNSLLRTPDDTVGKGARCPNCSEIEVVPAVSQSAPTGQPPMGSGYQQHSDSEKPPVHPIGSRSDAQMSDYSKPSSDYLQQDAYQAPNYVGNARLTASDAQSRLMVPAILLIILNILAMLGYGLGAMAGVAELADGGRVLPEDVITMVFMVIGGLMQLFAVIGSVMMLRMKSWGICVAASIVTLLSSWCCLLPIPFAIWALVLLMDVRIKAHFS